MSKKKTEEKNCTMTREEARSTLYELINSSIVHTELKGEVEEIANRICDDKWERNHKKGKGEVQTKEEARATLFVLIISGILDKEICEKLWDIIDHIYKNDWEKCSGSNYYCEDCDFSE